MECKVPGCLSKEFYKNDRHLLCKDHNKAAAKKRLGLIYKRGIFLKQAPKSELKKLAKIMYINGAKRKYAGEC